MSDRRISRAALCIPALVACAVYVPALRNAFVWDDRVLLYDQPYLRDPSLWGTALVRFLSAISFNYFRPLAVATFLVDARIWGPGPTGPHFTNILLHALNTLLVTLLARDVFARPFEQRRRAMLIALTGLLYALHPALVESVAFASSRFDLLMTTWVLLALLVDTRVRSHAFRLGAIGGLCLAAALTKETGIVLPVVLLLWRKAVGLVRSDISMPPNNAGAQKRTHPPDPLLLGREGGGRMCPLSSQERGQGGEFGVACVIAGVAYLAVRWLALGYLYRPNPTSTIPAGDLLQRLLLVARSALEYLLVIGCPFVTLSPLHVTVLPISYHDLTAWAGVLLVAVLAGGMLVAVRRVPQFVTLCGAGLVALLPALNILPLELSGGMFAAERYLTLPLAFVALAWLVLVARYPAALPDNSIAPGRLGLHPRLTSTAPGGAGVNPRGPAVLQPCKGGSPLAQGGALGRRTPRRQNYRAKRYPARAQLVDVAAGVWLLACVVSVELALPHWRDDVALWTWAAERAPRAALPHVNLSNYYIDRGDNARVLAEADAAIERDPTYAKAWNNRGVALLNTDQAAAAQGAWERATQLDPSNALAWSNLANAVATLGRLQDAERILVDHALRLDPNLAIAQFTLGEVYMSMDRPDLARPRFERALQLLPPNRQAEARESLARARARGG